MLRWTRTVCCLLFLMSLVCRSAVAQSRLKSSPVPPTQEIQVLDPSVDPLGNPAVVLKDAGDELTVDIPPAVLVHKFYYTGDRTFQAQLLPGGPSIVVCNHPKSGERVYVDVQLLPGAPLVTYTGRSIRYDYGENVISIVFGPFGKTTVRYRNGRPWKQSLAKAMHLEGVKNGAGRFARKSNRVASSAKTLVTGTAVIATEGVQRFATPVTNLIQAGPLSNLNETLQVRIDEHRRQKEIRHRPDDEQWIRTVR